MSNALLDSERSRTRVAGKLVVCLLFFSAALFSCVSSEKVLLTRGTEYWSELYAGDTTTLHTVYEVVLARADTLIYFTNYYQNGALKSKVTMKNDLLQEINLVQDTLGNKLDFGNFKNGNGYVIQFRDDGLGRDQEGLYVNGNREGWWRHYHYKGTIMDSTLYIQGVPQYPPPENALDSLLPLFGPVKNNLYN